MAKQTQVIYVSDLSGESLGEDVVTIAFGYRGKQYTIDLSPDEATEFDKVISPYVEVAAETVGVRETKTVKKVGPDAKTVRAWAKSQGMQVNERGRVDAKIIEAFEAAH